MYFRIIAATILAAHNPVSGNFFIDFLRDASSSLTSYGKGQQAIEESAEKSKLLLKQTEILNQMAGKENSQTVAIETGTQAVAKSIDRVADAQAETNKAIEVAVTGAQIVGICTGGIYIAKSVKEGVDWFNEWRNPNPEKAVRKEAAIKSMAVLKATDGFNKCLVRKRKEIKNAQGIPATCEEAYNEFVEVLGFDKAEQTVQAFKRFNQQ